MATRQYRGSEALFSQEIKELGGLGDLGAKPGSLDWAIAIRLELQASIDKTKSSDASLRNWLTLMIDHRGYLNLHKEDGQAFRSMEDFAQEKQPWGLGYEMPALDVIVQERLEGQRRQKLERLSGDERGARNDLTSTPSVNKLEAAHSESEHGINKSNTARSKSAATSRLRAIKERAPTIIRQFYEDNLIGEKEASKLGVCNPEPAAFQCVLLSS